jgi:nucleotide-binding universal stress UspA family protein
MAGEVVLGYDGNEGSGAALRTATSFAAAFHRPLVIVFGYRPPIMGGDIADLRRAVREIGDKLTKEAVEAAHEVDASVTVAVEMVDDRPADAILRVADEYDALAVVVGATGRGPLSGSLLGSVTYQVVHRSTRPVVVVPSPAED